MSDLTDYGENQAAAALLGTGTFYLALHTGDPGETGASNEVAATGYARQGSAFTASGSAATSDSACNFPTQTSGADVTVTHASIWDAVTGGNCICKGPLTAPRTYPNGGTFSVAAGDASLTFA